MWRIKATAKGRRKHCREQRSPEIGEGWEKVMVVGKVERREKEVWIAKLTVSFCLYKHSGSTSAPINNTQQISRLDRKGVRVAECWKGVCEHAAESECFDETRACKWKCTTVYVYCANIHILNILLCSLVPCVSSELSAFMACVCCLCIRKAFSGLCLSAGQRCQGYCRPLRKCTCAYVFFPKSTSRERDETK